MDSGLCPQSAEILNSNYLQIVFMNHQSIYNRLRRIEGQIRGIEDMLAKDRPDTDILIQLEAAKSSLSSTISSLIERMVEIGEDGKITLSQEEVRAILRSVKKS